MGDKQNVGGRDRLVRALLTVVLTVTAIRWLRSGKRGRGLLAAVGALNFGFNTTTGYCGVNDALGIDTSSGDTAPDFDEIGNTDTAVETEPEKTSSSQGLKCAACGDAIVPGQSRGPNEDGKIVHDDCKATA
jgi:hypothetical protein